MAIAIGRHCFSLFFFFQSLEHKLAFTHVCLCDATPYFHLVVDSISFLCDDQTSKVFYLNAANFHSLCVCVHYVLICFRDPRLLDTEHTRTHIYYIKPKYTANFH